MAIFKPSLIKTTLTALVLGVGISACGDTKSKDDAKQDAITSANIYVESEIPQGPLGDNVVPTHYSLDFKMNPREDGFSGLTQIEVDIKKPTTKIWMHGKHLTVTGAKVKLADGTDIVANYAEVPPEEAPSGVVSLSFDTPISGAVTLYIPYQAPYNKNLNAAYKVIKKSNARTDNYIITQMEAIGAREAFPSFDEPRFKVPFDVSITAPKEDIVYANTPEIIRNENEDGWAKHTYATTRPLPTYLIAFGIGPWDVVDYGELPETKIRKRAVPLRGIAVRGHGKDMQYALKNTQGIVETHEEYFGSPFPYEKLDLIAAPDYAFGAMENPGAIVFTEYLLMMDKNASLGQKRAYASVNSHELAHQWFGDLVTPVWWEDIWLNEAFATWMGNKTVDAWNPGYKFDRQTLKGALRAMDTDSLASTRSIREPLLKTENVMDQFDGITYKKGAGVLAMFEGYLGEESFQKGVRLHMKRFEDKVATSDDFFQSLGDGSGNDKVVPALKSFVDQPGVPLVSGTLSCKSDVHKVTLTQSRYAPLGSTIKQGQTWKIPVCAKYGADGKTYKTCTLLSTKTAALDLESQNCPAWLTLNADGAGYYRYTMDKKAWAGLLSNTDKLDTKEVLTVLDSLNASFHAGDLDAKTYLNGMEALAHHKEYDVAAKAGDGIAGLYHFLDKSAHPDLERYTRDLYAKRYAKIKNAKTMEARLLAPTLASRLVNYGGDTALAAKFAAKGVKYLGVDGLVDKKALAPNMLGLGLSQAFKATPETTVDLLLDMVKSGTPAEKADASYVLSFTKGDEALTARLLEEALHNEDTFTDRQASTLVFSLMGNLATQKQTWAWVKGNFDEFVQKRVSDAGKNGPLRAASGFCSAEKAKEVETFFKSKANLIPGYERALAQTLEGINLCAAFKAKQANDLVKALKRR
ncbi:MAG: M1 family metallopeptidase [Robiginitomaculum sp.]